MGRSADGSIPNDWVPAEEGMDLMPWFLQTGCLYLVFALLTLLGACTLLSVRNRRFSARKAVLKERNRLAGEIHDTLGQRLAAIATHLDIARDALNRNPDSARFPVEQAQAMSREGIEETRRSIWALRPQLLEERDLAEAVTCLAKQLTAGKTVTARTIIRGNRVALPEETEVTLLRLAQEALNNSVKHADARSILIRITYQTDRIGLRVSDDGRGFDPIAVRTRSRAGLGLQYMSQRIEELDGWIVVKSRPGEGTDISMAVPLPVTPPEPVRSLWSILRAFGGAP